MRKLPINCTVSLQESTPQECAVSLRTRKTSFKSLNIALGDFDIYWGWQPGNPG